MDLLDGDYSALMKRGITEETCRRAGYMTGTMYGKGVQITNIRDSVTNEVVAQKWRDKDKNFGWTGDTKTDELYGMHLWRNTGARKIVITEGEIDFLSVFQLQDYQWPVVSITKGAQGAKKQLQKNLAKLDKFKEIVLLFDNDEAGREAAAECAPMFPPGRCMVSFTALKDANEMLMAKRGDEVIKAIWDAKVYRPDGLVTIKDIRSRILNPPEMGLPWFSQKLTDLTYGRRWGEVYGWGAGSGNGKTDLFAEQIRYDIVELELACAVFSFEQDPAETGKRVAGKYASKRFHVPAEFAGWKQEELESTLDVLEAGGKFILYDSFGATEWDLIRANIRFLHHAEGVKIFYIDNLTALVADENDELAAFKKIMSEMAGLAKELKVIINYVSHLATPTEGPPHENGGVVQQRHFRGSRVIAYWSNFLFGLERDQSEEDDELQRTMTLRCVKDRNTGQASGKKLFFLYDHGTGRLNEIDKPKEKSPFDGTDANEDF